MHKIAAAVSLGLFSLSCMAVLPIAQTQSPSQNCFRSQTGNSIVFGEFAQQVRVCGNEGFKYTLNINGRDKEFDARSCVSLVASKIQVTTGDVTSCVSMMLYPILEQ